MPYKPSELTRIRSMNERHHAHHQTLKPQERRFGSTIETVMILKRWQRQARLTLAQREALRAPAQSESVPLLSDIQPTGDNSLSLETYSFESDGISGFDGKPKYMYHDRLKNQRHNLFIQDKKVFIGDLYNENAITQNLRTAIGATANHAMLHGIDADVVSVESTPPMIIDGLDDVAQMIIPNFPRAWQEPALGIVAMGLLVPSVMGAQGMYEEYCEIKEMIENNADTGSVKQKLDDLCHKLIDIIRNQGSESSSAGHQGRAIADLLDKHLSDAENREDIDKDINDVSASFEETLKGWQATIRQIGALGGAVSMAAVTAEMRLGSIKGFTLLGGLLAGGSNAVSAGQEALSATIALFNSALSSQDASVKRSIAKAIADLGFTSSAILHADFLIDLIFAPLSQATMTAWAAGEVIGGLNDRNQLTAVKHDLADMNFENPAVKEHLMQVINTLKLASDGNRTLVGGGMAIGQLGMLASTGIKTLMAYEQLKQLGVPLSIKSLMTAYEAIGEKGIAGVGPAPIVAALGTGVALTLGAVMQKFVMGGVSFLGIDGVLDKIAVYNGTESIKKHIKHLIPELLEMIASSESEPQAAQQQLMTALPHRVFIELQREVEGRAELHGCLSYALKALDNRSNATKPERCLSSLEQNAFDQARTQSSLNFNSQRARLHMLASFTDPNNDASLFDRDPSSSIEQGLGDERQPKPAMESMKTILGSSRKIMDEVKRMILQHQKNAPSALNSGDPGLQTVPIKERREWKDHFAVASADRALKFLLPEIRFFQGSESEKSAELTQQDQHPANWRFVDATLLSDEAALRMLEQRQDLFDKAERIALQLAHDNNLKREREATHGLILMTPFIAAANQP